MPRRPLFRFALHRPDKAREEMHEELAFHLDELAARLVAKGMTPGDARAEALRRLGNPYDLTEQVLGDSAAHRERVLSMKDLVIDFIDDLRYAARGLARRPAFTAVAVATLAIGIGANTAIFSAVDALLLRSLPYREPDRLMDVTLVSPGEGNTPWSWPKAAVFRDNQQAFSSWALYTSAAGTFTGENPERVTYEQVTGRYLATLGVRVSEGRDFGPEMDAGPGAPRQAIISEGLRQRRFGNVPNPIGAFVELDNEKYEIIGVMPAWFKGTSGNAELLTPIFARSPESLTGAWSLEFAMVARLKDGVSPEQGAADVRRVGPIVYTSTPVEPGSLTSAKSRAWTAAARPLDSIRVATGLRRSLLVLFGAVGMVLLIACVNIANLLLARATARRREIAVRLAIGATRGRLVRLLLAESLALSVAGGIASVGVAWWATRVLSTVNPADSLQAQNLNGGLGAVGFEAIHLDGTALLFAFVTTLVVGVVFGLVPALGATRVNLTGGLKDDGSGAPTGLARHLGVNRRVLVVAEVALAIVLLAGSGLATRSLINLLRVDAGFDPTNVMTLRIAVPPGSVDRDSLGAFYERLRARTAAVPGVADAALADCPPVAGGCNGTIMTFADRPPSPTGNAIVGVHWVTANWFPLMRVQLKRGRLFDSTDRAGSQRVIVINEAAAKKFFPGEDPLGKKVSVYQGGFDKGCTIIGVVGDVRFGTIDSTARPDAFLPYLQSQPRRAMLFVRADKDPVAVVPSVRAAIREAAPASPVFDVKTMDERVASATGQARLSATLLSMFALLALALAVMGIYGVMSFAVTQRTREIGIRVAMGADRREVVRLFTREGLAMSGAGVAIGLVGAFALTRVMRTLLFGVAPDDLATFGTIVGVVFAATLVATWIPARRAAQLDPVEALR